MELIDKAAVLAEIDKVMAEEMKFYETACKEGDEEVSSSPMVYTRLQMLRISINLLEVKEVNLEKYYYDFLQKEWFGRNCVRTMSEMMAFTAKHFFELGLSSQLSWQDVKRLAEIGEAFMNSEESDNLSEEEYYTEILNKFKVQKGE